jgi:hypothetical protein
LEPGPELESKLEPGPEQVLRLKLEPGPELGLEMERVLLGWRRQMVLRLSWMIVFRMGMYLCLYQITFQKNSYIVIYYSYTKYFKNK